MTRFAMVWFAAVFSCALAGTARGELVLSFDRVVNVEGIRFSGTDDGRFIAGVDVDPTNGHLWIAGQGEAGDDDARVTLVEFDPRAAHVLQSFNLAGFNQIPGSPIALALQPGTGRLFVNSWVQREDNPDFGYTTVVDQTGAIVSGPTNHGDVYLAGNAFDPAGQLFQVHVNAAGPIDRVDPASGAVEQVIPIVDTFVGGQNYYAADFDPLTGHLFLAGSSGLLEIDLSSGRTIGNTSVFDFIPLLPGQNPTVLALAFSESGDRVYVGGEFGLVALQRAVPEPSSLALAAAGLVGVAGYLRRRRAQRSKR